VTDIVDKRRARTLELVTETLLYYPKVGATEIQFDDLPGVHPADRRFVAEWIREQGFEIHRQRFSMREMIILQEKE